MKVVVVGGGIAGIAAARCLEGVVAEAEITLVEREPRLSLILGAARPLVAGHAVDPILSPAAGDADLWQ